MILKNHQPRICFSDPHKTKIAEYRAALQAQQKDAQRDLERSEQPEISLDKFIGDISARYKRARAKADFETREKIASFSICGTSQK